MRAAGLIFVLFGGVMSGVGLIFLVAWVLLRLRLREMRTRVRTIGAVSKLPRRSGRQRELEVTYLDPAGRPYVLRQRWIGLLTVHPPAVGTPVTVWHRTDRPEVADLDDPSFGPVARAHGSRAAGALLAGLGVLALLVGWGLVLVAYWV